MEWEVVVALIIVCVVWFLGVAPLIAKLLDHHEELDYAQLIGVGAFLTVLVLIGLYIISGVLWAFKTVGGLFG